MSKSAYTAGTDNCISVTWMLLTVRMQCTNSKVPKPNCMLTVFVSARTVSDCVRNKKKRKTEVKWNDANCRERNIDFDKMEKKRREKAQKREDLIYFRIIFGPIHTINK